jgi:hypothetical protein
MEDDNDNNPNNAVARDSAGGTLSETRTVSARGMYLTHGEYFDSRPGDKGSSIDDIVIAHGVNSGSERVFITKEALALARSLKLDVYHIFRNKREREHGTDGGCYDVQTRR